MKSFVCKLTSPLLAGVTTCSVTLLAALNSLLLSFATLIATDADMKGQRRVTAKESLAGARLSLGPQQKDFG